MNICGCEHLHHQNDTHIASYVKVVEGGATLSVDGRTLVEDDNGVIKIAGSEAAEPGQVARISSDGTKIEWYTPGDIQIDNRTIVKDADGNIGLIGFAEAEVGQVLSIANDGSVSWVTFEKVSADDKTITKSENGSIHIFGAESAEVGQIPRIKDDRTLEWFTPNHDDKMDKNVYDPNGRNSDIFAEIDAVSEMLHGTDGQYLSHNGVSTQWVSPSALQGDWNEVDETTSAFIKNKPEITSDDDALDTLSYYGYVNVIANESNMIFTDNSGKLYTL